MGYAGNASKNFRRIMNTNTSFDMGTALDRHCCYELSFLFFGFYNNTCLAHQLWFCEFEYLEIIETGLHHQHYC
jgi:hypothetical protein